MVVLQLAALQTWACQGPELRVTQNVESAISAGDWQTVIDVLEPEVTDMQSADEQQLFWYGAALIENLEAGSADPSQRDAIGRRALEVLQSALAKKPDSSVTALYLVRACLLCDRMEPVTSLAETFPLEPELRAALAELCYREFQRQYVDDWTTNNVAAYRQLFAAEQEYRIAVGLAPAKMEFQISLAEVLKRTGQTQEAIEHLNNAIRLAPAGYEVFELLGDCYTEENRFAEAAAAYELAALAAPEHSKQLNWSKGMSQWKADLNAEAVETFRELFRKDKGMYRVRFMLGRAAFDAEDYPLALFAFREAWNIDGRLDALVWSGACAYQLEDDELALQMVEMAETESEARNPGSDEARPAFWSFVKGRALWGLDRRDEALDELETAFQLSPDSDEYLSWLVYGCEELDDPFGILLAARARNEARDPETAIQLLEHLRKKYGSSMALRFHDRHGKRYTGGFPGLTGEVLTDIRYARRQYRTAWLGTSTVNVNSQLCWLALYAGHPDRARRFFQQLADHEASQWNMQHGRYGLAYLALSSGDLEKALQMADELNPDGRYAIMIPTIKRWAGMRQNGNVAEFDLFDCLGIFGWGFTGRSDFERGMRIDALITGSPLKQTKPEIIHGDVLLRVGDVVVNTPGNMAALRDETLTGIQTVTVRRDEAVFDVEIDFDSVREEIRVQVAAENRRDE